jgi:succinate-acetate transporter protein
LVGLLFLPKLGLADATSKPAFAAYFFMWGLFTFFMFLGTLRINRALQFVFLSLTILFFLLAARDYLGSAAIGTLAGYEGIICGLSAIYAALAQVLNEVYKKVVAPLGPMQ